jgi:hypothetical protein
MLVQDTLTGYFHEVPDSQVYGPQYAEYPEPMGKVVYDGLGNPVGLSFLAPLAAKILPAIASRVLPAAAKALPGIVRGVTGALQRFNPVAQAAQRVLPGLIRQFTPAVQAFQQAVPAALQQFAPAAQAFQQALPGAVQQLAPVAQAAQQFFPPDAGAENEFAEVPMPIMQPPFRPFMPPGWIPRPQPYTGMHPRPVYMRCLTWRGPRGLVPAAAAHAQPGALPSPPVVMPASAIGVRRPVRVRRRR